MSSNFFVDFGLFYFLGALTGADWMVTFSTATFLALATGQFQFVAWRKMQRLYGVRKKPNFSALPAFRKEGRRHADKSRKQDDHSRD